MATEWEYTIQISSGARLYLGEDEPRYGIEWNLTRSCPGSDGRSFSQTIVSSAEVFDDEEDAKRDATEKLALLGCTLEKPIAQALRWQLQAL